MTADQQPPTTINNEEDTLYDVTLHGIDDGPGVPAVKATLTACSPVFERMFCGRYQESDAKDVTLEYSSIVLQVIVKFCETSELDIDMLLQDDNNNGTTNDDDVACVLSDEEAVWMVELRDAANYLEMMNLHRAVCKELVDFLSQKDALPAICAILNELYQRGQATSEHSMFSVLMVLIEHETTDCFLSQNKWNHGILACQPGLFIKLMKNRCLTPLLAVKCLQLWSQTYPDLIESSTALKLNLHQIAKSLDLEKIPAKDLEEIKPCFLFSNDRLGQGLAATSWRSFRVSKLAGAEQEGMKSPSLFAEGVLLQRSVEQLLKAVVNIPLSNNSFINTRDSIANIRSAQVRGCVGADLAGCNGTYVSFDAWECSTDGDAVMLFKEGIYNGGPSEYFLYIEGESGELQGCTLGVVPKVANEEEDDSSCGATGVTNGCAFSSKKLFEHRSKMLFQDCYAWKKPDGPAGFGLIPYLWELESKDGNKPKPTVFVETKAGCLELAVKIRELRV